MPHTNPHAKNNATPNDFLIRGSDYLARTPGFELIGRDENLSQLAGILMRKNANNALITGPGGVGLTALTMGLQASKDKDDTPFDLMSKRFYWLDVDGLFSSGDPAAINEGFNRALRTLSRAPDTVLVLDDMKDFVEAARNNGCTNLINSLMREIRNKKFQACIEVRDEDLDTVLKCHSDMREVFTLHDVNEPTGDALRAIADKAAERLSHHHGIVISPDAVSAAIELTNKYRVRDMGLSRAQPERTMTLLDRALTSYRLEQHAAPAGLRTLEERLKAIDGAIAKGATTGELAGKTESEIETLRLSLETDIGHMKEDWASFQSKLRGIYKEQRDGEELLRGLEDELQTQRDKEAEAAAVAAAKAAENPQPEAPPANGSTNGKGNSFIGFAARMNKAGFESEAVQDIRRRMSAAESAVADNKAKFDALTATHDRNLVLDTQTVLKEFSTISGIAADKLSENEREKLLHLEANLGDRVFGQENAVGRLADSVITSRIGKKRSDKPPAFLFIGPSGVGKTEIAKALAASMLDDENALLRFDMSEYMEKHAVAKMIGAPPGYEGFDVGGILTNAMRRNPRRIILFDEIEKAHPDVFNIFLQILGDGRLTDNVGRTVSFADSMILMTSNLGQAHFLDTTKSRAEQFKAATDDMTAYGLRPEFLNRFNGRENIVPFNALTKPVIEKIVTREIKKINESYADEGIQLRMSPETLKEFVDKKYDPAVGARGLPGYINANVESKLARTILANPDAQGEMDVRYDAENDSLEITPPAAKDAARPVANDHGPQTDKKQASAAQAFSLT